MITRIVKLHLKPGCNTAFTEIFIRTRHYIEQCEGNVSVSLQQDIHQPNIMYTLSKWESEAALEQYRNSDTFITTWKEVKTLLQEKTEATSLKEVY